MNAIEKAMLPLRTEAIRRARDAAHALIEQAYAKLAQSNHDFDATAPRGSGADSRSQFIEKTAYRGILTRVTRRSTASHGLLVSPRFERSAAGEASFLASIEREAAKEFDEYVAKISIKAGPCDAAEVSGAVWDGAVVRVTRDCRSRQLSAGLSTRRCLTGAVFEQSPIRAVNHCDVTNCA